VTTQDPPIVSTPALLLLSIIAVWHSQFQTTHSLKKRTRHASRSLKDDLLGESEKSSISLSVHQQGQFLIGSHSIAFNCISQLIMRHIIVDILTCTKRA
jgi:hypothetical protein